MCELPFAWIREDKAHGTAVGALIPERNGYRLEGGETAVEDGAAYTCRFTVHADLAWATRSAHVEVLSSAGVHRLDLSRRGGLWTVNGERAPELDGCGDVDIAATPLTNTLPVRRLGLRRGEHRAIAVAWISVPDLRFARVAQRYTRLEPSAGNAAYEYRDPTYGAFHLTVDHEGLVLDYEGLYRRIG